MSVEAIAGEGRDKGASAALLKAAHRLTADLMQPRPWLYWGDLIASCAVGYGALILATLAQPLAVRVTSAIVAVLALYRAVLFIHELTHVRLSTLPGFWTAWNALVGVPLLMPSFFYEGVHTLHHAKSHYGTVRDPEYFPLAHSRAAHLVVFVLISAAFPLFLVFRALLLAPVAALVPPLRRVLMERFSALCINPQFVRPDPTASVARRWFWLEVITSAYAWTVVALVAAGMLAWSSVAIALGIGAGISLVNQFRTLVAHHWENDGEEMDAVAQLLDTVNVPPPALLPMLWAPVGLRYHGLHHFLPGLPYHNLGEAHRRMMASFPLDSPYHKTSSRNAAEVIARMLEHQARARGAQNAADLGREPAHPR